MRRIYVLLAAVVLGIASALLAFKFHSLFYCLIPIWAFAVGYLTSWRWGLLNGFLLFTGYTVTMSMIHNSPGSGLSIHYTLPFDYVFNFVLGGFSLLLIASVASMVRKKGIKHKASMLVIFLLAATVGYCSYTSFPRYEYSYLAEIRSLDMQNIEEIYLPMPAIAQEPNTEILKHQVLPLDYSLDLAETEQGLMLRVSEFKSKSGSGIPEHVSIEFKQEGTSYQTVQLMPKYEAETVNRGDKQVKVFKTPLRINVSDDTEVTVMVSANIRMETNVNFFNFKSVYYSDSLGFQGEVTSDEWLFAEGQTVSAGKTRVTGASGY